MRIIGLTSHESGNHDASAALLVDGVIKNAIAEERITRKKHDTSFSYNSLFEILSINKTKLSQIDFFVSASPMIKPIRFWMEYVKGFVYTDFASLLKWFLARLAIYVNGTKTDGDKKTTSIYQLVKANKIKFVSHYLAHAHTAHCFSGFKKSLVVAWDGYGMEMSGYPLSGAVYIADGNNFKKMEEIPVYTSLALYYGAVTVALGFKLNDGEGKTMGLAVYGKKSNAYKKIKEFFPYFTNNKWNARSNWLEINGVSRPDYFRLTYSYRYLRSLVEEYGEAQVAYAAQRVLEEEGSKFFTYLTKKYKIREVSLAGGIFLNVKFNMLLLKKGIVSDLFVYPNPSDGGVSVGGAIAYYNSLGNEFENYRLESAYLGREFSNTEILKSIRKFKGKIIHKMYDNLALEVSKRVASGSVVGIFVKGDEWGPRALGARSVIADPRDIKTKERINDKLKQRDWFMPFAPVILKEKYKDVLKDGLGTSFMTLTDNISTNYLDKIPAAIHIDGTARAQIIDKEVNDLYWSIVNEFYKKTGIPVLLNTSFNKHGLPIVHTPDEAIEHLIWGCVDELVLGKYIVTKANV